jgi:hypothetical protein
MKIVSGSLLQPNLTSRRKAVQVTVGERGPSSFALSISLLYGRIDRFSSSISPERLKLISIYNIRTHTNVIVTDENPPPDV